MMKKLLIVFILTFAILACRENSTEFNQNEIIEYYPHNPKVVFKKIIHKTDFDSVYFYYDNGALFKKGKQYRENQKFGIWQLYDKEANLREIREWFTINGKSRANRVWHLSKKGDTIAWRTEDTIYKQKEFINDTIYFRNTKYDVIYFNKDTIKLNESLKGYIEIWSPVIRDYPPNVRAFIAQEKNNFNYDFSNKNEIKLDTFYDLTIDIENQKWFPGADFNDLVVIGKWFDTTGEKIIRGYYQQYFIGPTELDKNGRKIDSIIGYKTYFEKKVVVIDSI